MSQKKAVTDNVDFTRFESLTRRLVTVPKDEADAQRDTVVAKTDERASEKSAARKSAADR